MPSLPIGYARKNLIRQKGRYWANRAKMLSHDSLKQVEAYLRAFALGYPQTIEDFPWDHRAFKVKGKTFLFLFRNDEFLGLSVKLPDSCRSALFMPFAKPTAYGLGKSGWVTARFTPKDDIPLSLLEEWIDESFRAIAPKTLAEQGRQIASQSPESEPPATKVEARKRKPSERPRLSAAKPSPGRRKKAR